MTSALTVAGSVMGTLDYMAPEQATGQPVDQRADIYALGLIFYDIILGRAARPKTGNPFADFKQRLAEPLASPRTVDPTVPEPVDALIIRCLQADPEARFQTSDELGEALDTLDEHGNLKPIPLPPKRSNWVLAAAGVLMVVAATGSWFLGSRFNAPAVAHEPVAVVIADFQNQTGDPSFDRTLEPIVKLALEGAGFISAFDRSGIARTMGVKPPEVLDEKAAVEIAVKQGVGMVLSGVVTKQGDRFDVAVKAAEAVSGKVIAEEDETASAKDGVLGVVDQSGRRGSRGARRQRVGQRSALRERNPLGHFARRTALVCQGHGRAVTQPVQRSAAGFLGDASVDPKFGLAYAGMAITSSNMGRQQDAEKYVKQAIELVDGMTERERYRTRGMFYFITNDYQPCVKEYGDLIAKFSADAAARNNRALCLSKLRDMKTAVDEMREVVKILPNRALYRVNLATYAAYNGDVATAEQESRIALDQSPWALQPLALAQTLQGQLPQAAQTYRDMSKSEQLGPSYTASGLGDLALYEGRYDEAARIFSDGAAADFAAKEPDRAGAKLVGLAYTELLRNRKPAAIAAAEKALEASQTRNVRFLAARVLVDAGAPQRAKRVAVTLGNDLQPEAQALASIIDGMIAMTDGDNRNAVRFLTEANTLLDTWIGHFELGRAYLTGQRLPAGGLGIRSLCRPPRRGAVVVPRRRVHLRLLPVGALLSGTRA